MKIEYDPQADALYVELRQGEVRDTLEVGKNLFVDVDEKGEALGIEILYVSRRFAKEDLTSVTFNIGRPASLAQTS
ncbi:MAG: DUF2283 domain-containing protein [Anaerolineae bacterium]|nr:DUF2283 domain-containing protein [Anaerolineae bacterium]